MRIEVPVQCQDTAMWHSEPRRTAGHAALCSVAGAAVSVPLSYNLLPSSFFIAWSGSPGENRMPLTRVKQTKKSKF